MFQNMTPHAIVVICDDGTPMTIPPSGTVLRVSTIPGAKRAVVDGVSMYAAPTYTEVEGLPAPVEGVYLIVSSMVAAQCVGRKDVVSPGTGPSDGAVRDKATGNIIAVVKLIHAPSE